VTTQVLTTDIPA